MTIYLYVKTHRKTGLKYLGKTTSTNPHTYHGSGGIWKQHLKEHGIDYDTKIIRECRTNQELSQWGRYYSELWNVVESSDWANQIPETGGGGNHTEERKELFRQQQLGKMKGTRSEEHKKNLSAATKGIPKPRSKEHQLAWNESSKRNWDKNPERKKQQSERISTLNKERTITEKTREKRRQSMLKYWETKKSQSV